MAERRGFEPSVPLGIRRPGIEPKSSGVFAAIMLEGLGREQVRPVFGPSLAADRLRPVPLNCEKRGPHPHACNRLGSSERYRRALVLTMKSQMARWLEAETYRLKIMGMSFQEIADHVIAVAQGKIRPLVALPEGAQFKPNYKITKQACVLAHKRALKTIPAADIEEFRKEDTERCEAAWLALQKKITAGDSRAVEVGMKVLERRARLNGLDAHVKVQNKVESDIPFTVAMIQQYIANWMKLDAEQQQPTLKLGEDAKQVEAIEAESEEVEDFGKS